MPVPRRSLVIGAALLVVGCTGDPRIDVPDDATPRARSSADAGQDPLLARAAAALTGLGDVVAAHDDTQWRAAALAQIDDQIARCNSADPFAAPSPVHSAAPESFASVPEAVGSVVSTLRGCADEAPDEAHRLLFVSAAAATQGLTNTAAVPGEGSEPTAIASVRAGDQLALTHVWALIQGLELGLGRLSSSDPLRARLAERLPAAKLLRSELLGNRPSPSQPAAFAMPGPMSTPDEIRAGWQQLEVRVLEGLVLRSVALAGDTTWAAQVAAVQACGARVPRWPGWE